MAAQRSSGICGTAVSFVVAAVTVALIACGGDGGQDQGLTEAKAGAGRSRSTPTTVAALGRLEPASRVVEVAAPLGDRVASLLVEEGDSVAEGDILALLESHGERAADLARISSRLEDARRRLQAETTYGRAQIAEASLRVRELEELRPHEVEALEARVASLEAQLQVERLDLDRTKNLHRDGVVSQAELDHQTLVAQQTEEELRSARATFVRLRDGSDLDLSIARAKAQAAGADLVRSEVAAQFAPLENEKALAEARVERATIRAPVAGEIFQIHTRAGETTGQAPILSLGDTRNMLAVAEVYETDVRFVEPGQRATILTPALAEPLSGEVIWVGSSISRSEILDINPAADTDRRVVEVKVRLDDSEQAARFVNLQVDVRIDTGRPDVERTDVEGS